MFVFLILGFVKIYTALIWQKVMAISEVPRAWSGGNGIDVTQPSKVVALPVDTDVQGIPIVFFSFPRHFASHQLSVEWSLDESIKELEMCKNQSVQYLVTRIHHVLLLLIGDTVECTIEGDPATIVSSVIDASSVVKSPGLARSPINVESILLSKQVNRNTFWDAVRTSISCPDIDRVKELFARYC